MFFTARDGRSFPVSSVTAVRPREDGIVDVDLSSDRTVEIHERSLRQIPTSIIPAQPDTYIVRASENNSGGFWRMQVVAWAFTLTGAFLPVTADGVNDGTDEWHFIHTPDGRVSRADDGSWETIDAWLKSQPEAE